jgi:catechol 2,3-dioxygenase
MRRVRHWTRSSDFIRDSPQFAANPIGVPVDPAAVVAARGAGASASELHERAYAGDFIPHEPIDLRLPVPDERAGDGGTGAAQTLA